MQHGPEPGHVRQCLIHRDEFKVEQARRAYRPDQLGKLAAEDRGEARDAALGGHLAASTLVTVPALARPECRMEIAVLAAA